jgi:RNA polymerase sigma-70 factor (ECF subfamily)
VTKKRSNMTALTHAPNVPQVADTDVNDPKLRQVIDGAAITKSPPQAWYRTMGHNPEVAKAFAKYWDLLHRGGAVPHEIKELARIQIAQMIGCDFCARQTSPLAATITEEEKACCALPNWEHPDAKTRAALHYARTLTLDDGRDTEVYEELKEYYSNADIIELAAFFCLTAGGNRMAKSWSIEPHGGVSAIPAGAMSIHGGESMGASKPHLEPTEAELIQRACQGDKEAFYSLVRPCERAVYTTAVSILNNPEDAEEVAQEAVLKALAHLAGFRGEAKFSTWLIQITINEARLKLRKDRRHLYESVDEQRTSEDDEYFPKDFADWREIPSEALQRKEVREALKRAIACLPLKYREVFVLRDVQQLRIEEAAQILGITQGSVKTRLLRARLRLRDALAPGIDGSWSMGKPEYQKVRPW